MKNEQASQEEILSHIIAPFFGEDAYKLTPKPANWESAFRRALARIGLEPRIVEVVSARGLVNDLGPSFAKQLPEPWASRVRCYEEYLLVRHMPVEISTGLNEGLLKRHKQDASLRVVLLLESSGCYERILRELHLMRFPLCEIRDCIVESVYRNLAVCLGMQIGFHLKDEPEMAELFTPIVQLFMTGNYPLQVLPDGTISLLTA